MWLHLSSVPTTREDGWNDTGCVTSVCVCVYEERALWGMSLQDRDKTTAYSEACFLGISVPSPKSTVDVRRHPSEDDDGLPTATNCLP